MIGRYLARRGLFVMIAPRPFHRHTVDAIRALLLDSPIFETHIVPVRVTLPARDAGTRPRCEMRGRGERSGPTQLSLPGSPDGAPGKRVPTRVCRFLSGSLKASRRPTTSTTSSMWSSGAILKPAEVRSDFGHCSGADVNVGSGAAATDRAASACVSHGALRMSSVVGVCPRPAGFTSVWRRRGSIQAPFTCYPLRSSSIGGRIPLCVSPVFAIAVRESRSRVTTVVRAFPRARAPAPRVSPRVPERGPRDLRVRC
eukprot:6161149-Prymnesium_polylepis.1